MAKNQRKRLKHRPKAPNTSLGFKISLIFCLLIFSLEYTFGPQLVLAYSTELSQDQNINIELNQDIQPQYNLIEKIISQTLIEPTYGALPESNMHNEPKLTKNAVITAYNSDPAQTDDTPCITASGLNICQQDVPIVANNCLRFGTRVSFPKILGSKIYIVQDRMNARYGCERVDILMETKPEAKQFGIKRAKMYVW